MSAAYQKNLEDTKRRQRAAAYNNANIGPPAPCADPGRRAACEHSLRQFCETYLADTFNLEWSDDHVEVIGILEDTLLKGGKFALAMARGSGKSSLCLAAAMWAILYGHKHYLVLVGATAELAKQMLAGIKTIIETNDLIGQDFPEVCHPIRSLQGVGQRRGSQHINGRRCRVTWGDDELQLPDVEGAICAGAMISTVGIEGSVRGLKCVLPDGRTIRPDVALVDDPQTDESARSLAQCARRERAIKQAVGRLCGPDQTMSVCIPCTVIAKDDLASRLLNPQLCPEYQGRIYKLLPTMPDNMDLWKRYREIRKTSLQDQGDIRLATEFYRANRAEMDKGATASWEQRFEPGQISAIQYAMDVWAEDERVFYAEFQNEPLDDAIGNIVALDPAKLFERRTIPIGIVPDWVEHLTCFIDVQGSSLWWLVAAWSDTLRGHIVDYGVWPRQSGYVALADVRVSLIDKYRTTQQDAILAGLSDLSGALLGRQFKTQSGATRCIDQMAIDANWNVSEKAVYSVARTVGAGKIYPWHGRAIAASHVTMDKWRGEAGDRKGVSWILQKGRKKQTHLVGDTNYWKSFIASRLSGEVDQSSITLPDGCLMDLADNLGAEYAKEITSSIRTVHEWSLRPGRDNHWLDGLVGCAVLASVLGARVPGEQRVAPRQRPKASEIIAAKRKGVA